MRRSILLTFTALLVGVVAAGPATAASVHFKPRSPQFVDQGVTLTAFGQLAGLGNGDVLIVLAADADATTTCTNPGGNQSPGQNPADVTVRGTEAIPAEQIKNGTVAFSVTTAPPDQPTTEEAGCPNPNWSAAITDLAFTSARITVIQGGEVVLVQSFTL